jgi:cell wall-associated NlpC family hydrolase
MTYTTTEVSNMLAFMEKAVGTPYLEENPQRFGPNDYDCSGLIWAAAHAAGINFPGGPSDPAGALANVEADYFATQPGTQTIKSANQIQEGDLVFFTGAAPGPSNFGPIGHVGMATSSTQYVSAYDTAEGTRVNPISGDNFVVAVRLTGGSVTPSTTAPATPSGSGISIDWGNIPQFFKDADSLVTSSMWLLEPSSWVRIAAFLFGIALICFALYAFIRVGQDEPMFSTPQMPTVVPVPI